MTEAGDELLQILYLITEQQNNHTYHTFSWSSLLLKQLIFGYTCLPYLRHHPLTVIYTRLTIALLTDGSGSSFYFFQTQMDSLAKLTNLSPSARRHVYQSPRAVGRYRLELYEGRRGEYWIHCRLTIQLGKRRILDISQTEDQAGKGANIASIAGLLSRQGRDEYWMYCRLYINLRKGRMLGISELVTSE